MPRFCLFFGSLRLFCRYYAMPLAELLPDTARSFRNLLLGVHEMAFDVLMWTDAAREAVFRHLRAEGRKGTGGQGEYVRHFGNEGSLQCPLSRSHRSELSLEDIELLPTERVRLTWQGTDPLMNVDRFRLQDAWTWNTHLPNVKSVYFTCTYEGKKDPLITLVVFYYVH